MLHLSSVKKFGRVKHHRDSMLNNQLKSLIEKESIYTTLNKAKVLKANADKIITTSRKEDKEHASRLMFAKLQSDRLVRKVFILSERMRSRNSGFTTHVSIKNRVGDNAVLTKVEWIDVSEKEVTNKSKISKKAKSK
ncbi:50S ribosomal protein L17 [bacterium]|nr:MAG: 50S ribosomal protein L17 [bacterium]